MTGSGTASASQSGMNAKNASHTAPFHLLIRSRDPVRSGALEELVRRAGHRATPCAATDEVPEHLLDRLPDGILVFRGDTAGDELAWASRVRERLACGLILATEQWDRALAKAAAAAGFDAFLSIPATPASLNLALFQAEAVRLQMGTLRDQTADLARRLAERKLIERAKGVLMTRRQFSEEQAFRAMRSEAMRRRISLACLSAELLDEENGGP